MKKNTFSLLFFAVVVAVVFSSCKDDDDNNGAIWCTDCVKSDVIGNYVGSGEYKTFKGDGSAIVTEADSIYLIVTEGETSGVGINIGQQDLYTNIFSGYYNGGYSFNFTRSDFGGTYTRMTSSVYKNEGKIQIKGSVTELEKKITTDPPDTSYVAKKVLNFEVIKTE
ncbi:MAG: hypothetical protein LBM67_07075 [Lentimicrobiaceae bacterium]|jgi:hypothetical protein|nr:hypothetical protein [Lentimicrobiaceae bacterium]